MSDIPKGKGEGAGIAAAVAPPGETMDGLLGALTSVLPGIAIALFGKRGEQVATAAVDAAKSVTGKPQPTGGDIFGLQAAERAKLCMQLAKIVAHADAQEAQDRPEAPKASSQDMQTARTMEETLVSAKSPVQWAPVVMSGIILVSFFMLLGLLLSTTVPDQQLGLAQILLGALASMAVQVANFWLGSSSDSRVKTHLLVSANKRGAN